ncbi:MAG TPA: ABC transporter permease [Steroidobacteraceae bacterium]|nr:ABC transporter permease [Steroidobacteraceae bacterium]
MLSSYFAAAWRAFLRDRLYAIINIIGLAIGLSAALLSGLYVRNELTFERFLPGYQNIYRISAGFAAPGAPMSPVDPMPPDVAPWLINHMPSIQPVARISVGADVVIRVGQVDTLEHMVWADPALFDIFRYPIVQGDLLRSLERPDGVVLTRSAARRLFGHDRVVGETLELDHEHTLRVAAVIQDLPSTTHLGFSIIGSARAEFSTLRVFDQAAANVRKPWDANTYFRLGGLTLVAGLLAGAYPAALLGSVKPVAALKGGPIQAGGMLRSLLVTAQFAVLIGLLCTIIVVFEQISLAAEAVAQLDTRGVFAIKTQCGRFSADRVRTLPRGGSGGVFGKRSPGFRKTTQLRIGPRWNQRLLSQGDRRQRIFPSVWPEALGGTVVSRRPRRGRECRHHQCHRRQPFWISFRKRSDRSVSDTGR